MRRSSPAAPTTQRLASRAEVGLSRSRGALLSARRPRVSSARRLDHPDELERAATPRLSSATAKSKLRGFDDHATRRPDDDRRRAAKLDAAARLSRSVPVLRHRHEPDHPAMRRSWRGRAIVQLTIDAALQFRVAAIVARQAAEVRRAGPRRSCSIPIPATAGQRELSLAGRHRPAASTAEAEPAIRSSTARDTACIRRDRPSSSSTAAAALLRDPSASRLTFTCSPPARRPGRRAASTAGPAPDPRRRERHDAARHDRHARRAGAFVQRLLRAARRQPRAAARSSRRPPRSDRADAGNNAIGRVRDTLPQIGYGQGDVVASPLRMARVAAAIAADGTLRDARSRSRRDRRVA